MAGFSFNSASQWAARTMRRVNRALRPRRHMPRNRFTRLVHDQRIRDSENDIKGCLWPFGNVAGVEL